nr:DUF1259 domain-containing protein [Sinomonas notoginsengisoli]
MGSTSSPSAAPRPPSTATSSSPPPRSSVIQALRKGGIDIVELHSHRPTEQPRLFYMHFWAVHDGAELAKALRPALDVTNLKPVS